MIANSEQNFQPLIENENNAFCRVCFIKIKIDNFVNIFETINDDKKAADVIKIIGSVEVSEEDVLSKIICSICVSKLRKAYEFRKMIIDSDIKQREISKTKQQCGEIQNQKMFIGGVETKNSHKINSEYYGDILSDSQKCNTYDDVVHSNFENLNGSDCEPCIEEILNENCEEMDEKANNNSEPDNKLVKKQDHTCEFCSKTFKKRSRYLAHICLHTGIYPFHCDICKKGFPLNNQLNIHRQVHFEEKAHKCEDCGKTFRFYSGLHIHQKIHKQIRKHKCDICGLTFIQSGNLSAHKNRHTKARSYICETCGKSFVGLDSLCEHTKSHKNKFLPCPKCGKNFSRNSLLKKHLKTHLGLKPVTCEICDKPFTTKQTLKMHKLIHTGVRPHSCQVCGRSFTQAQVLQRHTRIHSGERPYSCSMCEKKFSVAYNLKNHVKKYHGKDSCNLKLIPDMSAKIKI